MRRGRKAQGSGATARASHQIARLPKVIFHIEETVMNESQVSSLSRRAACGRLLGLAGTVPLAMSWLGGIQRAIGAGDANGNTMRVEED